MGVQRFLRDKEVAARYGISRPTVWRWVKSGALPPPVHMTAGAARWPLDELEAAEAQRKAERAA